ncbi:hypothetical protein O0L34_g2034 [Tuta absoluta]|nr:hypothetical protein O0L34_g2034 [Tuta absoluta]
MFGTKLSKFVRLNQLARGLSQKHQQTSIASSVSQCQQKRFKSDLYEPDYLISMEPDEPVYDCLNLQLKGYDYALLEAAQGQIHRYAEIMGIEVEECWATPATQYKVQRFKPGGTVVDAEYHLNVYERNVQVADVPAWALGSLLRVSRAVLPEGCTLHVHEHTPDHEEIRYVPDNQLLELKAQLEGMGGARTDKRKRR